MARNMFDTAYVLGYTSGYHGDKYENHFDKNSEPQLRVKYKHGYEDGFVYQQEEFWKKTFKEKKL